MSLTAGSVTVSNNGDDTGAAGFTVTSSGLAKAIFDADVTGDPFGDAQAAADGVPARKPPDGASQATIDSIATADKNNRASAKASIQRANLNSAQGRAKRATAIAAGVVTYFTANAEVVLTGAVATVAAGVSLGQTPNPNNPATAIVGPAVAITLPVTAASVVRIS